MESDISYVRQDYENYDSLRLLFDGAAKQLEPEFTGDLRFAFLNIGKLVVFDWVGSVMYCDELLWTRGSYPYFHDLKGKHGLYEVGDSSYLKRMEILFPDHRHYVYFDREFNWHITARGIEVIDLS